MWYRWDNDDLLLHLLVQPKASKDQFVGPMDNSYKVRITAPPVDGKANEHLVRLLSKAFSVPKTSVVLETGATSRRKRFRICSPHALPLAEIKTDDKHRDH